MVMARITPNQKRSTSDLLAFSPTTGITSGAAAVTNKPARKYAKAGTASMACSGYRNAATQHTAAQPKTHKAPEKSLLFARTDISRARIPPMSRPTSVSSPAAPSRSAHCRESGDASVRTGSRESGVDGSRCFGARGILCSLTFELSGSQRWDARPGLWKMRHATDRAWWPAVGAPLERGVRLHITNMTLRRQATWLWRG